MNELIKELIEKVEGIYKDLNYPDAVELTEYILNISKTKHEYCDKHMYHNSNDDIWLIIKSDLEEKIEYYKCVMNEEINPYKEEYEASLNIRNEEIKQLQIELAKRGHPTYIELIKDNPRFKGVIIGDIKPEVNKVAVKLFNTEDTKTYINIELLGVPRVGDLISYNHDGKMFGVEVLQVCWLPEDVIITIKIIDVKEDIKP